MKTKYLSNWLVKREKALWICLLAQILVYWTLAFVVRSADVLVAYQRY